MMLQPHKFRVQPWPFAPNVGNDIARRVAGFHAVEFPFLRRPAIPLDAKTGARHGYRRVWRGLPLVGPEVDAGREVEESYSEVALACRYRRLRSGPLGVVARRRVPHSEFANRIGVRILRALLVNAQRESPLAARPEVEGPTLNPVGARSHSHYRRRSADTEVVRVEQHQLRGASRRPSPDPLEPKGDRWPAHGQHSLLRGEFRSKLARQQRKHALLPPATEVLMLCA